MADLKPCEEEYGFDLISVVQPISVASLCDAVRHSSENGNAVYPLGGRTRLDQGLPPSRPGIGVDLRQLAEVIDYPARDMTITAQAGSTLARLNEILASENQRLPIDVPFPELATLGGAIATNASGPRRYGLGTFRDYVIGITTINDRGEETKAGGRVVKNVAGYDMCKLHIGALGTLGVISQVTLKVRPRPESHAIVVFGCKDDDLAGVLDRLNRTRTQPACLEVLNALSARRIRENWKLNLPADPWLVLIGFEHNQDAVDWQVEEIQKEIAPAKTGLAVFRGADAEPLWNALTEIMYKPKPSLVFKANLLPSATPDFCRWLNHRDIFPSLQSHAGNGIVTGRFEADQELGAVQRFLDEALGKVQAHKGNLILLQCPAARQKTLPVWGAPRSDNWLMRAVKNKLDPRGLFNPGRFV